MRYLTTLILLLVSYTAIAQLSDTTGVIVVDDYTPVPVGSKFIGKVNFRDGLFKLNCGYFNTIQQAKQKVRDMGGNVLKITKLKQPSPAWSNCYQVVGGAYSADSAAALQLMYEHDTISRKFLPADAAYAVAIIYRPTNIYANLSKYDVFMGDRKLSALRNEDAILIRIYNEGPTSFWVNFPDGFYEEPVDIRFGHVYFFQLETPTIVWERKPYIIRQGALKGYAEYRYMNTHEIK
jgi:hypothetical protein